MIDSPTILFETSDLIVIDKPAGWIVNSAQTTQGQPVIEEWLAKNFDYQIFSYPDLRHGIVHRLDKDTSGCLIVAKNQKSFVLLQNQFKERKVHKTYVALAHGKLKETKGDILASVGRLPWRRDRFGVLSGGRDAKTSYKLIKQYQKDGQIYSYVELAPLTGRTHQIRIHLKYLGNPIVSDAFYAGRKTARKDKLWCPRLFLHAARIAFNDPVTGKKVRVESPLAEDLKQVLQQLT